MQRHKKTYGFTIVLKELRETVPNIFRYASAYKRVNNITSQGLWEMFIQNPETEDEKGPKGHSKKKKKKKKEKQDPLPQEIRNTEPGSQELPKVDQAMEGEDYNMCHFWSNFEIARLDWFRSQEYQDFFDMMDRSGGFWMERVGLHPFHRRENG
jgi:mannosyltransferase